MKINLSEYPDFKDCLVDLNYTSINKTYRSKGSVYVQLLFDIEQDDIDWLLGVAMVESLPPDLQGLWLSNQVTKEDYCGIQFGEVTELTEVERKERQIITTEVYYEPVNQ